MNITDLIVELIEQGVDVQIAGIGTLQSALVDAHHDAATGTFYPATRAVAFSIQTTEGAEQAAVDAIAKHECVNREVAVQMWRNYTDALADKLQRSGSHTFGHLGDLTYSNATGYGFNASADADKAMLANPDEQPMTGVATYSHEGEADPFAQFDDNSAAESTTTPQPQPEPEAVQPEPVPELGAMQQPVAEPAPVVEPEPVPEPGAMQQPVAEPAPIVEPEPVPEPEPVQQPVAEPAPIVEPVPEPEPVPVQQPVAEPAPIVEPEPVPEPEPVQQPVAEPAKAEPTSSADDEPEPVVLPFPETQTTSAPSENDNTNNQRKRKPWWILLLILLLLVAGGAYYYFTYMRGANETPVATADNTRQHPEIGAENSLTYNCDMIEYGRRDVVRHAELVNRFMISYIDDYLAMRNYRSARVPMIDRVRQYSTERLGELLGPRFAVQRLIPYNDYIYHYNEPFLKEGNARRARVKVQSELMQGDVLDGMLDAIVAELGLQPDASAPRTAQAVQEVKKAERAATTRRTTDDNQAHVFVEKGSKQGFDLIAGFYLNKATAASMAGRLHSLGCDAYIIEFNDLYYVSMGSASTQTAADALLKHVKSWYDGDVVIKKW